ncbi:protein LURP-one-related 6-like [Andrographis paniculata]|uniref:protein LURP-one-related 6-like n=1 Tax=Andrographis paniculata TaxID=175694 RepID=UPI0021E71C09|nr:protein LURP-one-related 6-like [Andrographis paniculata]
MAAAGKSTMISPIVSKLYCAPSDVVLMIRRRPKVVNGGGLVASDCSADDDGGPAFRVDCGGGVGRKEEMVLRDGDGNALLLIRRNGSMVEAVSMRRQWRGMSMGMKSNINYKKKNNELVQKLVFTLKQPRHSCLCFGMRSKRISIDCHGRSFQVLGDFPGRCCTIVDSRGDVLAQIGMRKEMKTKQQVVQGGRDVYGVEIKAGMDQAFVCGIIAVLDCIYDGSSRS